MIKKIYDKIVEKIKERINEWDTYGDLEDTQSLAKELTDIVLNIEGTIVTMADKPPFPIGDLERFLMNYEARRPHLKGVMNDIFYEISRIKEHLQ